MASDMILLLVLGPSEKKQWFSFSLDWSWICLSTVESYVLMLVAIVIVTTNKMAGTTFNILHFGSENHKLWVLQVCKNT